VRSLEGVTRALVAMLDRIRVGGSKRIAQMLVRAGKKISTETVRRYRKSTFLPKSHGERDLLKGSPFLRATEPNHIWMTDIIDVPSLSRIWIFKLVVVLGVYSRFRSRSGCSPRSRPANRSRSS